MSQEIVFYTVNTLRVSKGKPPEVVFSSIFDSFRDVDNHLAQYVIEKLTRDHYAVFCLRRLCNRFFQSLSIDGSDSYTWVIYSALYTEFIKVQSLRVSSQDQIDSVTNKDLIFTDMDRLKFREVSRIPLENLISFYRHLLFLQSLKLA